MHKTTRQRTAGCPCWQHYAGKDTRPLRFPYCQPRQSATAFPFHQNEESHAVRCPMQRTAFFQPISSACLYKGMNCPSRQPLHPSEIKSFEIRSRLARTVQSSTYYQSTAFHLCPQEPLRPYPREQAGTHNTHPGVTRHLKKPWSRPPFLSSTPIGPSRQCPPQQPVTQLLSLHHGPAPHRRTPCPAPTSALKKEIGLDSKWNSALS